MKVLPRELLQIFTHAHSGGTQKKSWVFSDSFVHLGKNKSRATSKFQIKEYAEYSGMGSFHKQMHFASKHGGELKWMVESVEQLIATYAKDGLAENFQDEPLGDLLHDGSL